MTDSSQFFQKAFLIGAVMFASNATVAMEPERAGKPTAHPTPFPRSASNIEAPLETRVRPVVKATCSDPGSEKIFFWDFSLSLKGHGREKLSKLVTNQKIKDESFCIPLVTFQVQGEDRHSWSKKYGPIIQKNIQTPLELRLLGEDKACTSLESKSLSIQKFAASCYPQRLTKGVVVPIVATFQDATQEGCSQYIRDCAQYGTELFNKMRQTYNWKANLTESDDPDFIVGDVGGGQRDKDKYVSEAGNLVSILNKKLPEADLNKLEFDWYPGFSDLNPCRRLGSPSLQQHWTGDLWLAQNSPKGE